MSKHVGADSSPAYSADPATCRDMESACRGCYTGASLMSAKSKISVNTMCMTVSAIPRYRQFLARLLSSCRSTK